MPDLLLRLVLLVAGVLLGARWLRVAQREHYLAGRCSWAWRLWLSRYRRDVALVGAAAAGLVVGAVLDWPLLIAGAAVAGGLVPLGLPHRGRSSKLAWTSRLRRIAVPAAVVAAVVVLFAPLLVAGVVVAAPFLVVDLTLWCMAPVEARLSKRFLDQAQKKLRAVRPKVVAITGSYGKTTTKQYVAHLISGARAVVPSPASFNNAMGLARAVNEHLVPGTEVFIAEMGTYGPGEIRRLCGLFPPDVSVITAVDEVHLERMKTLDRILQAKAEITEKAAAAVLNVDDERLAGLADRLEAEGRTVVRVSTLLSGADVLMRAAGDDRVEVLVRGESLGEHVLPDGVMAINAAAALGVAVALGVAPSAVVGRLGSLPSVAHRMESQRTPAGGWIIDDTYNSNPRGAAQSLQRARALAAQTGGGVHLVTPGMVEMGSMQAVRNAEFAEQAVAGGVQTLVVVGRTNGRALTRGAAAPAAGAEVLRSGDRTAAVAAVSERTKPGDVVIFENDLPDHYP
ncbi:MAG: UDP-N-acetylmuramoyl-tripeptide--D-alanyl-D-alan ine ligase [Frankiales bacterium]|nr:UDP-N-acetylmuramoyl-tripeptide--D-alanyl-D-alan ine ligase [Frankiales bacterium]